MAETRVGRQRAASPLCHIHFGGDYFWKKPALGSLGSLELATLCPAFALAAPLTRMCVTARAAAAHSTSNGICNARSNVAIASPRET